MASQPAKSQKLMPEAPAQASCPILTLNDDCLYMILSYFNIRQLIGLERVCRRFKTIAEMIYKTSPSMDLREMFCGHKCYKAYKQLEVMKIAKRVGKYVHTLTATRNTLRMLDKDLPKFIYMHCNNLQNIDLYQYVFPDESVPHLANAFRNVKRAELDHCYLKDEKLMALLNVDQLEVLNVKENFRIRGKFLAELKHIREINVSGCYKLDVELFKDFCEKTPQLRSLNIENSKKICKFALESIATHLTNLEKLTISNYHRADDNAFLALKDLPIKELHIVFPMSIEVGLPFEDTMDPMGKLLLEMSLHNRLEYLDVSRARLVGNIKAALVNLKKLKVLKVNSVEKFDDTALACISCVNTLEKLFISNTKITLEGLSRLIERCPSLRYIGVMDYMNFDEDLDWYVRKWFPQIFHHVQGRSHVLEIRIDDEYHVIDNKGVLEKYLPKLKITFVERSYVSADSSDSVDIGEPIDGDELFGESD